LEQLAVLVVGVDHVPGHRRVGPPEDGLTLDVVEFLDPHDHRVIGAVVDTHFLAPGIQVTEPTSLHRVSP
jgi:hypothetical protein